MHITSTADYSSNSPFFLKASNDGPITAFEDVASSSSSSSSRSQGGVAPT